ncbi:MAG: TIGR00730 family Rossman fold protein [Calditrichaeota bacterium]|nr:TIGR00730 family Rossman fold protein [Calditrichota bacterium]HQU70888.1 TIGR00730 family Rossman fold protein [Calditrichia bacterium]
MGIPICLFTASSNTLAPVYVDLARQFGTALAQRGHSLVYGGGMRGLMGAAAEAAQENGGKVVSVIPEKLDRPGIALENPNEKIVTRDMGDRKATMEDLSEAFVVLPGGFGTFDELFQVLAKKQLCYHNKPIVLLDVDDFFKPFSQLAEHLVGLNFAREIYQQMYTIVDSVEAVFDYIDGYQPLDYDPFLKERG